MSHSQTSRRQTWSVASKIFEQVVRASVRAVSRLMVPLPATSKGFPDRPVLKAKPDPRSQRRFLRIVGAFLLRGLASSRMLVRPMAPVALIFRLEESLLVLIIGSDRILPSA